MPTVRKRRSRKNARINTTQYGKSLKRKNLKPIVIPVTSIRRLWDKSKGARHNMERLGLSHNPNKNIRSTNQSVEAVSTEAPDEEMDTVSAQMTNKLTPEAETLLQELSKRASWQSEKRTHIPSTEAEYLIKLLQKHGSDCKVMVRDKLNYLQMTEAKLRKRCYYLLTSKEPRHIRLLEQAGLVQS